MEVETESSILRIEEMDYIASKLAAILGTSRTDIPEGNIAEELAFVMDSITGSSGRVWRSARDILLIIIRSGGKARFRDFQQSLPYHDSTMARALKNCLEKSGVVSKEDVYWVLNPKQLPLLLWLSSRF